MSIQSRSADLLRVEETFRKAMGDLFSRLDESNRRRDQADRRCDHTLRGLRNDFVSLKYQRSELTAKLTAVNGGDSSPASIGEVDLVKRRAPAADARDLRFKELHAEFLAPQMQQNELMNRFVATSGGGGAPGGGPLREPYFATRQPKVGFPIFSGEDLAGWIIRCDHFFAVDLTPEDSKVRLAVINFEGRALQWFQLWSQYQDNAMATPWILFLQALEGCFGDHSLGDPMTELLLLKQTGSFSDYHDRFKLLLGRVTLSETYAISLFINGLRPCVQPAVRLFMPRTLGHTYALARLQEELSSSTREGFSPVSQKPRFGDSKVSTVNTTPLLSAPIFNVSSRRLLTPEEMADCFDCDEKFDRGHQCVRKQLLRLELGKDVVEGEISECGEAAAGASTECREATEGEGSEFGKVTEEDAECGEVSAVESNKKKGFAIDDDVVLDDVDLQEESADGKVSVTESTDYENERTSLLQQVDVIETAVPGAENCSRDELVPLVTDLVNVWWTLRRRRVSLFGQAAQAFINYLSRSSFKSSDCQSTWHDVEMKYKHVSYTLRAKHSPWSLVYPTLVDANSPEEGPLERRLTSTAREPYTPHEVWFVKEYQVQIRSALAKFKTSPASIAALGEVWRPLEAVATSSASYQRKSSISFGEVAPQWALLLSAKAPMPGLEKQIGLSESEGREDLRLDASIMQLLQSVNAFPQSSSATRRQSLGVRYYSVFKSWQEGAHVREMKEKLLKKKQEGRLLTGKQKEEASRPRYFGPLKLKRMMGRIFQLCRTLPTTGNATFLDPVLVLERRLMKRGNRPATQILVHWANSFPEDATWEFLHDLQERFPHFQP